MYKKSHLDVGCGSKPRNPFNHEHLYGVDIIEQQYVDDFNYSRCNVVLEKLPFEDSSFDSLSAYDFLEHIPRFAVIDNETQFPFINFMNEAYRVLKNEGVFYAMTPVYPRKEAFVDPTHVNIITSKTHEYFTNPGHYARMYGFEGNFEISKVKLVKFSQEMKTHNKFMTLLKDLFYSIVFYKKSHIVWEFKAIKNS